MKQKAKLMALLASLAFTVAGYLQIDQTENMAIPTLSFLTAALFFYTAFGKKVLTSFSLTKIKSESRNMVAEDGKILLNRSQTFKVALLTFLAVVVTFGIGFGLGRIIYQFIH
ncbi:MAG: hypothetical protein AAGC43_18555 [Bacteroidota bacterium]